MPHLILCQHVIPEFILYWLEHLGSWRKLKYLRGMVHLFILCSSKISVGIKFHISSDFISLVLYMCSFSDLVVLFDHLKDWSLIFCQFFTCIISSRRNCLGRLQASHGSRNWPRSSEDTMGSLWARTRTSCASYVDIVVVSFHSRCFCLQLLFLQWSEIGSVEIAWYFRCRSVLLVWFGKDLLCLQQVRDG